MRFSELQKYAREQVVKHPSLKASFVDHLADVRDEINDDGSEVHECESAYAEMQREVHDIEPPTTGSN